MIFHVLLLVVITLCSGIRNGIELENAKRLLCTELTISLAPEISFQYYTSPICLHIFSYPMRITGDGRESFRQICSTLSLYLTGT